MSEGLLALPALLLPWYERNARPLPWRADRDPYRVWVSEIMLQQTRVEAVRGYYERFLTALPDIPSLAAVGEERLLKLWEGLGYYSRARNLKRAAECIMQMHGGAFPRSYEGIRALPGIGDYTAGAIASICFDEPTPAIDGNVVRVLARLTERDAPDSPRERAALRTALAAIYPRGRCGDFTQALMELGATVCLPNGAPQCARCPLAALCMAHLHGTAARYPVRPAKRARRIEERTVLLLIRLDGSAALQKRPARGLLAGLWELPNLPGTIPPEEALRHAEALGAAPLRPCGALRHKHVFTHIEWHMTAYPILCAPAAACNPSLVWADAAARAGAYALPSAFRPLLEGGMRLAGVAGEGEDGGRASGGSLLKK